MYGHQIRINAPHPGFHLIGFYWPPPPLFPFCMYLSATERREVALGVQISPYLTAKLAITTTLKPC